MFSGIIERQGKVIKKEKQGKQLLFTFQAKGWDRPLKRGESIAVNGVCLTVVGWPKGNTFSVQAVSETLKQTTLGNLRIRDSVNLERSLKWGERIGGHFVLGHADGVGAIVKRFKKGNDLSFQIEMPAGIIQNLVPKGSLAVDGVSLTIQELADSTVTVAIIPHTAETTGLGKKKRGDLVNLEADVIAKHLARLVVPPKSHAEILSV